MTLAQMVGLLFLSWLTRSTLESLELEGLPSTSDWTCFLRTHYRASTHVSFSSIAP
jgi:hypothetical protein